MAAASDKLYSTPNSTAQADVTFTNTGNVVQTVNLGLSSVEGISASGFQSPITLSPGESVTQTVNLSIPNLPLNSTRTITVTATPASSSDAPQTLALSLHVVSSSALTAFNAANAASTIGRPGLGNTLDALGQALTSLSQNLGDEVARSRAIGLLNSLIEQLNVPALTPFIADLTRLRDAIAAGADIPTALNDLSTVLGNLGGVLQTSPDALPFELALQPNSATALPNTPTRFDVALHNTGTTTATYNLSLSALPAGITGGLNQTSVTLAPGQSIPASGGPNVFVTLTPSAQQLAPARFSVTAALSGNPNLARTAEGAFTVRDELVEVVSVAATPGFTDPGGSVAVSARLLNAVNQSRQVQVSYTVRNAQDATVFTSSPRPAQLTVLTSLFTVDLGNLDTTGFPLGTYTLNVAVADANGAPIPGATGQGTLLVGSPLSATQALTPDILPPGDGIVTASLNLNSLITLPGPAISLLSLTDTDAIASSLAIRDNLAYVCGTENVTIFDITDPSQPQILATFADNLINGSFNTKCRIVDDHLVVFWQIGTNANALPILVFDLANPTAPNLVSNTNQNRHFISTLFFRDRTAYMALAGIRYSGCFLSSQFGDFATFDFDNFTNPQFLDALLNPTNPPDGGTNYVWQGIPVNDQVALVASSTSTGAALPGVGRILAVDVSDPANLSTITELQVPGTVHITGVEVQGNLALAVGNTGNFLAFDCSQYFALTGNVTLTTLDINNPRNPAIIKTITTTAKGGGTVNALGNGFFSVSGTSLNGNPVLMVVDANNPQNPTFTTIPVPAAIQESQVVGNHLFAPSSSGLGIYDIGNVVGIRYKAQIQVPKNTGVSVVTGSFNLEPTEIVSGADFDTLVWERALTNSHATQTFTWQAQVADLQPGEARDVTLATTVDFTAPNGDTGQIELPPLIVVSEQILALTPASQTTQLGSSATYILTVKNPTAAPITYNLAVLGVPSGWTSLAPTVTVPANGSVDQVLTLQADAQATPGDNGFVVTAEAATGVRGSVTGLLTLQGTPGGGGSGTDFGEDVASDAHGIVVTVTPEQPVAGQGTPATFRVRLINTGNVTESFNLAASLPAGISGSFDQTTVEVPPGLDNYREELLTVTPARGTPPGTQTVTVTATATTQASVQDEASTTLTVASQGVDVAVSPTSGSPGGTFQLIVTNTGQAQDTFDLTLGGPLGPAATLGAQVVTLAPGASQTVSITLGAIDFALPGALSFIAVATSRANPAVRDTAMVQVTIPTSQGLTVAFDPKSQTLPNPGLATFLLLVHNTGNTEGAYRAVITGTNGPVTASMDGLDGQPTQSIATFRLPGLSIGAITVDTDLKSAGTGKVMVEVAALDAALTGTDTATVRAQDQPPPQPSGPAAIPTLDEWMQALLALLMLLALAWVWRRRYGR